MKVCVPDYYKDFKCIAGTCTDTCCAGWQVDVDDRSYDYYRHVKGPFGDRLRSVMIDGVKGAEGQFRIRPDGRCPFLNDNNLCDLYTELGEDALCVTCDMYPRYTCEFGSLKEMGIALSCKTAAELILKDNRTPGFTEYEEPNDFPALNTIDAEFYFALRKARDRSYEILWNRKWNIWERMTALMYFATDLQKNIRHVDRIQKVIVKYNDEFIGKALETVKKETIDSIEVSESYKGIFYYYLKQMIIKPEWPELVDSLYDNIFNEKHKELTKEFNSYYKDRDYEFENIITYFIFRYFMKAVFDKDVLTKVKMGIVSTLVIRQCDLGFWYTNGRKLSFEEQVNITHLYSREVEHSEENFSNLCKIFTHKRLFVTKMLVLLLLNNA